jgi:hypothetical protein
LTPNIYVLDYLTVIGQLTASLEAKIRGYLQIGYQNQLAFQHTDGSYSAFGNSDTSGSVWLTAFTIQSFVAIQKFNIFVDQHVLDIAFAWLVGKQIADGSFPEVGNVIHKGKF